MREGKPSFTAAAVALARGIASVDDVARDLLSTPYGIVLRANQRAAALGIPLDRALNVALLGLVDHIELRTRAIDAALLAAIAEGKATQLVILGAGLDARAYRIAELAKTTVLEVDFPSTQAYKRARVARHAAPMAREIRYVAIDFEKDSLGEKLAAAGHTVDEPTFWIWEGVTPYLHIEAIRATLREVAARSARDSRIAVTYGTPDGTGFGRTTARSALKVFRAIGEEIRGLMDETTMARELEDAGFRVVSDEGVDAWPGSRDAGRIIHIKERLAIAARV
jgi:methyltransferase (TIGR00027 family)